MGQNGQLLMTYDAKPIKKFKKIGRENMYPFYPNRKLGK